VKSPVGYAGHLKLCQNSGNTTHGRDCAKTPRTRPLTVGGIATFRRSVLSIARGQRKDRYSVGVTCSPTAIARASSQEVTPTE
jgi:hypothetical protein